MGSVVTLFLAGGFGQLRTSRDFKTRAARLEALATTFQPMLAEAGRPGSQPQSPAI
ncbi:hypothetical protein [Lacticaseibacillus suibinensis]|uniref:hypothetical protein n=1 Tax=Lacticaseibacillus suibinensis TaxID=2486011 RepID=UPI001943FD10|nr:hypothetical protein [Lacticaseibacillus suibinensis]